MFARWHFPIGSLAGSFQFRHKPPSRTDRPDQALALIVANFSLRRHLSQTAPGIFSVPVETNRGISRRRSWHQRSLRLNHDERSRTKRIFIGGLVNFSVHWDSGGRGREEVRNLPRGCGTPEASSRWRFTLLKRPWEAEAGVLVRGPRRADPSSQGVVCQCDQSNAPCEGRSSEYLLLWD